MPMPMVVAGMAVTATSTASRATEAKDTLPDLPVDNHILPSLNIKAARRVDTTMGPRATQ